jgi:thiamine-monophosphate kinase
LECIARQEEPSLQQVMQQCVLAGGDDYELCFTAPVTRRIQIEKISAALALPLTRIGKTKAGEGYIVRAADGSKIHIEGAGYDHFA